MFFAYWVAMGLAVDGAWVASGYSGANECQQYQRQKRNCAWKCFRWQTHMRNANHKSVWNVPHAPGWFVLCDDLHVLVLYTLSLFLFPRVLVFVWLFICLMGLEEDNTFWNGHFWRQIYIAATHLWARVKIWQNVERDKREIPFLQGHLRPKHNLWFVVTHC